MKGASAWLLAIRPKTLTAAVAPVLLGTAVASRSGRVAWLPFLATLLGAILLQVASNFANDVFDFEKGADTAERLGPPRAVAMGLLSPRDMKRGLALVIALSLLIGLYLTHVAGPIIVVIGIASLLSAVAYTGGPYPLGYHGLGDVFVFVFFGFVAVCGTVFVHLGRLPGLAWLASLPLGALATNILIANNVRDRLTDRTAGKKTLVVRFGRRFAEVEFALMLAVAYLVPLGLFAAERAGWLALLPLVTLPLGVRNWIQLRQDEGAALNRTLVHSAQLVFVYGALFSLGLWLDGRAP